MGKNYNGRGKQRQGDRQNRARGQGGNRNNRSRRKNNSVAMSLIGGVFNTIGWCFKPIKLYLEKLTYTTDHFVPHGSRLYWRGDKIVSHSTRY
jgi:hypothetical protein